MRYHEAFMVAEVMPVPPPDQSGQAREEVVDFLGQRGHLVRLAQHWICGVGLFEVHDAAVNEAEHTAIELSKAIAATKIEYKTV